ncbi:hypothetical protein EDF22_1778 [Rathayibacter sp. PhB127]|uniref:hypothetical protein n=1 Tax=unclassified Rathayibacter TaxID=2609250 RepID=UPI000F4B0CC0|nr:MULTISPECIES: hypothetical protein [unclassified Rathayibacter]ROS30019.1 hypothetical protein EDF22_1778 [Rathayibacter sp. PhB127]TDX79104.1 hypothetical protein EDF35_2336 [Rathayibacter sp. PhB151]
MTSPGQDQTTALRSLLVETVEQSTAPRPARARGALITGLVAVPLAAALVLGVVVLDPGAGSAEASEALRSAADATITVEDPIVGAGQYLKITTEAAYLAYEVDADGDYTAYLSPSITEVFIPADAGTDWVQRVTAEPATAFYGEASRAAAERDWASTVQSGVVQITKDPEGDFVHAAELGGEVAEESLPTDPGEALAALRRLPWGDGTDAGALSGAAELLRSGTLTGAERSTLYRALAMIPGIRIADGSAVLDGRTGIAFSLDADADVPEIVIDPATGLFIGERTLTSSDQGAIPAGTEQQYTAVTTLVVDRAL